MGSNNIRGASTTPRSAGGADPVSEYTDTVNMNKVTPGNIYSGKIVLTKPQDGLYNVKLDSINHTIVDAVWAAGGVFSALLGFKINFYPTVGTRVLVVAGKPAFIVGGVPASPRDDTSGKSRTMTGIQVDPDPVGIEATREGVHHTPPNDLLEGEFEISNGLGVAVQLLHGLAMLKAGDRAKVETSLLNDMVRIVSEVFKHHSAFGDMQIYNDGRINVRFDGTNYEHEAWGSMDKNSPHKFEHATVNGNKVDLEGLIDTGRWRYSHFLGHLGDFIHMFVTDPTTALSNIADDALRSGKAHVHINSDGSMLLQSVAEIALERVCRIVTPVEKKRWDDPEGDKRADFEDFSKDPLRTWKFIPGKVHHTVYQLREYARWLSGFHAYARFRQQSEDWDVPTENSVPTPTWSCEEQDKEAVFTGASSIDAYAVIRIMRDGSIVLWDGAGSSVCLSHGDVSISSVRNTRIDAGGDVSITAGNSIFMKARDSVEITASTGSFITKARASWKALCELGSIWLKSDAVDPKHESVPAVGADDPVPEVLDYAIFLDTTKGKGAFRTQRELLLACDPDNSAGVDDALDKSDYAVTIAAEKQHVRILAKESIMLRATRGIVALESLVKGLVIKGRKVLVQALQAFDINTKFTVEGGKLNVEQIAASRIGADSYLAGPKIGGRVEDSNPPPFKQHYNHVLEKQDSDTPEFVDDISIMTDYNSAAPSLKLSLSPLPVWEFPDPQSYRYSVQKFFEPLAQQYMRYDFGSGPIDKETLATWIWEAEDNLKSAPRTNTGRNPFPGKGATELYHQTTNGENLRTPAAKNYADYDPNNASPLQIRNTRRLYIKR